VQPQSSGNTTIVSNSDGTLFIIIHLAGLVAYTGFCLVYVQETLWGIKPAQLLLLAAILLAMYRFLHHSGGYNLPRPVPTFFVCLRDSAHSCGPGLTLPFVVRALTSQRVTCGTCTHNPRSMPHPATAHSIHRSWSSRIVSACICVQLSCLLSRVSRGS